MLFACALTCSGVLAPAPGMAAEGRPAGGMRQPIGPGAQPPVGGPVGGPPIGGRPRPGPGPGPMRPGADPADIFSPPGRPVEKPQESRGASISFRGTRYFVSEGQWFEQKGRRLVAIEPPAGVLVRDLPKGHSMHWIGGVPYFYADGLYYVWREGSRRYEILQSPPTAEQPPPL